MEFKSEVWIDYRINKKTICFRCSDIGNVSVATAINEFLQNLSKGKKVFLHGYRLEEEELPKMVETGKIPEKAEMLYDPSHVFLNISDAKINVHHLECACEAFVFYFDSKVKWTDFLASSYIHRPKKYIKYIISDILNFIKEGILYAYFVSMDHGADFWFECSKEQEENVLTLLRTLADLGCIVKQVRRLSFLHH